jgi:hypothetical protein
MSKTGKASSSQAWLKVCAISMLASFTSIACDNESSSEDQDLSVPPSAVPPPSDAPAEQMPQTPPSSYRMSVRRTELV